MALGGRATGLGFAWLNPTATRPARTSSGRRCRPAIGIGGRRRRPPARPRRVARHRASPPRGPSGSSCSPCSSCSSGSRRSSRPGRSSACEAGSVEVVGRRETRLRLVRGIAGWAMLAVVVLAPVFLGWYFLWALPAASPSRSALGRWPTRLERLARRGATVVCFATAARGLQPRPDDDGRRRADRRRRPRPAAAARAAHRPSHRLAARARPRPAPGARRVESVAERRQLTSASLLRPVAVPHCPGSDSGFVDEAPPGTRPRVPTLSAHERRRTAFRSDAPARRLVVIGFALLVVALVAFASGPGRAGCTPTTSPPTRRCVPGRRRRRQMPPLGHSELSVAVRDHRRGLWPRLPAVDGPAHGTVRRTTSSTWLRAFGWQRGAPEGGTAVLYAFEDGRELTARVSPPSGDIGVRLTATSAANSLACLLH